MNLLLKKLSQQKGFIGIGVLMAILFGLLVVGVGAYYVDQQNTAIQQPPAQTTSTTLAQATNNSNATAAHPASPTPASVTSQSQPQTFSVPGMSQYKDTDFDFSFWYPTMWTVTPTSQEVTDYNGGSLQKSLLISNGTHSITLSEYTSPSGIYDVCGKCDDRIYYDQTSNSWMDFTGWTIEKGLGGAHTDPADISIKTIGGLPLMWNSVVALDPSHFVVADGGNAINDPTNLLLRTISSLNPTVASKSAAEQQRTVQAEANVMGATITSSGSASGTIDSVTPIGTSYPVFYDIEGTYQNAGDIQLLLVKGTDTFSTDPLPRKIGDQLPSNVVMDTCDRQFSPCYTIKTSPFAASGAFSFNTYDLFIPNGLYTMELYTIPNTTNNNSFQLLATKQVTVTTATQ